MIYDRFTYVFLLDFFKLDGVIFCVPIKKAFLTKHTIKFYEFKASLIILKLQLRNMFDWLI